MLGKFTPKDYKLNYALISSLVRSSRSQAEPAVTYARKILMQGKLPRCGKVLRREAPEVSRQIEALCQEFHSGQPGLYAILYDHACRVFCGVDGPHTCSVCSGKYYGGNSKFCSRECVREDAVARKAQTTARRKSTCRARYGRDSSTQADSIKKKARESNLRKRGVPYPTQDAGVREKIRLKVLKNWGVSNVSQSEEIKKRKVISCFNKYGVESPLQSEEVQSRRIKRHTRRFGVGHPMQRPEIFSKTQRDRYKGNHSQFLGKPIFVRGYELEVLNRLEKNIHKFTVSPAKMPKIMYGDATGRVRRYFPDILLETTGGRTLLIEVKSWYTLGFKDVLPKAKAAVRYCSGFDNLEYWIAVWEPKLRVIQWIGEESIMKNSLKRSD